MRSGTGPVTAQPYRDRGPAGAPGLLRTKPTTFYCKLPGCQLGKVAPLVLRKPSFGRTVGCYAVLEEHAGLADVGQRQPLPGRVRTETFSFAGPAVRKPGALHVNKIHRGALGPAGDLPAAYGEVRHPVTSAAGRSMFGRLLFAQAKEGQKRGDKPGRGR
jgi:hypothetical protein